MARLVTALARRLGDFDLAEDIAQDALTVALERWPVEGIPREPFAWLLVTARRKGIDRLRRAERERSKLALLERTDVQDTTTHFPDERLALIFTCCHPALPREARIALTLRSVAGLTTAEIARAFVAPEATIAQRIVRAKRKIVDAAIPLRVPEPAELPERLAEVLAVLYLVFNEGYLASGGDRAERRDLAEEAEWLCGLVTRLLPDEPEALGLHALMRTQLARAQARFDERGGIVLLEHQDRARWDGTRVADARKVLERAARMGRPGRYQLQAAIALVHAEARSWEETDWPEILGLYDLLALLDPSPVVRLNRAIALAHVAGPATALAEVERLSPDLDRYPYLHATRAAFLRELGRADEARDADRRALDLTENPAERALLRSRIG
ncbi:MAG TPA: DUF6596 domain-containing protein [Candidatus Limnocylindria bacterium]|nr:DUF6596 domain-containing protein [Candidatus Limnocylindria bacterium]